MRRLFSISQLSATRRLEETLPPPLPAKGPGVEADKMTPPASQPPRGVVGPGSGLSNAGCSDEDSLGCGRV